MKGEWNPYKIYVHICSTCKKEKRKIEFYRCIIGSFCNSCVNCDAVKKKPFFRTQAYNEDFKEKNCSSNITINVHGDSDGDPVM
jgi:hypothetical protein